MKARRLGSVMFSSRRGVEQLVMPSHCATVVCHLFVLCLCVSFSSVTLQLARQPAPRLCLCEGQMRQRPTAEIKLFRKFALWKGIELSDRQNQGNSDRHGRYKRLYKCGGVKVKGSLLGQLPSQDIFGDQSLQCCFFPNA